MRTQLSTTICGLIVLLVAAASTPALAANPDETTPSSGTVIVGYVPSAEAAGAVAEAHDEVGGEIRGQVPELSVDVVEVDDVDAALADYASRPGVRYVEVDGTATIASTDDPLFEHQWNFQARSSSNKGTANVAPAWQHASGEGIVVAVVDTGVKKGGDDLARSRILSGRDFVNDDTNPADDHGHGTHIAGTVAQTTGNGKGAAGVAPSADILPVKVLNASGAGSYSDVIDGILWARDQGAHVINLSLSGSTRSQALCDAVANVSSDALVVAAVGNDGEDSISYPAACDASVAVGSVRYDGQRVSYSNTGPEIDLVAPGGDLDVDQNDDDYQDGVLQQTYVDGWQYTFFEGTSMAAAHASGAAALVLDVDGSADLATVLTATARDLGPKGHDEGFGHGALDALAAVERAGGSGGDSSEPSSGGSDDDTASSEPIRTDSGYWLAAREGSVHAFGGADATATTASAGGLDLAAIASTPTGKGYWVLDVLGGVHTSGDARYFGSLTELKAQGKAPAGVEALDLGGTPSGDGYWILDEAGGIHTFGDAGYHGSLPGLRQAGHDIGPADVVDIASTASGDGYWILDSVGGMFSFGDADFHGSIPDLRRRGISVGPAEVVAMAPTSGGDGYWLVDDAGGMFSFGDAEFHGSIPGLRQAGRNIGDAVVVAMEPTSPGDGYWLVDDAGGIFTFGGAKYHGSLPGIGVTGQAVGIAPAS